MTRNPLDTLNYNLFGSSKPKNKRQSVAGSQKSNVKMTQKGRCFDCHKVLVVEEYHHVKHVANNGKSTTDNLVALCPECHRKRHIKEKAEKIDKKKRSGSRQTNSQPKFDLPKFKF